MNEFNIEVNGGSSVRLLTFGKFCDRDIVVTATGGDSDGYDEGYADGQQAEYDAFWDAYQQNGNRTDYFRAFAGTGWAKQKAKYVVKPGAEWQYAHDLFSHFAYDVTDESQYIDLDDFCELDLSQATTANSMFAESRFRTVTVDFYNLIQASSCFLNSRIKNLYIRLSEKCTTAYQMFTGMTATENIIFTEDSVLNYNFDFRQSTKLTHESLMSIINALKDYSGTSTTNTCTLGATNLAKLTDAEKAIATQKGWSLV